MHKPSSNSVRIFSVDRAAVERDVTRWATELRRSHPEVETIYWFGSWTRGTPSPGSDVDICIVVTHSDKSPRDRSVEYRPSIAVPIDLLVYTREEFDTLVRKGAAIAREITRGRLL